jgi:hypothetical protein
MSNLEFIRTASPEELADFLKWNLMHCDSCIAVFHCAKNESCEAAILAWLKDDKAET